MIILNYETGVTPMDVWQTYMAIQLHFKKDSKYDAFKFAFKGPKMKRENLESTKNKWVLERLARSYTKKNDLILFFLSNTLAGNTWIGSMSDDVYQEWTGKIQRLDYTFKSDMSNLLEKCKTYHITFDESIRPKNRLESPLIYSSFFKKEISLESLVILENLLSFSKDINKSNDPLEIISDITNRIIKYKPFLRSEMNLEKQKKIILNLFTAVNK